MHSKKGLREEEQGEEGEGEQEDEKKETWRRREVKKTGGSL